jgi:hypothetical protein
LSDLRYVDDPWEDEDSWTPNRKPKWMLPRENLERRILRAIGRKYYPDKKIRHFVVMIVKSSQSLDDGFESKYPTEWIEFCCEWAESKRARKEIVSLKGLVTFIMREEAKEDFLAKYEKKYGTRDADDDDVTFSFRG